MAKKNSFTMNVRKGGVTVAKPKPKKPEPTPDKDKKPEGGK